MFMWWRDCFKVSAQLFYEHAPKVPFEFQELVERGKSNGSTYISPVFSRRRDLEGVDGYGYLLVLPANCGGQDGYHAVIQFIPRKCQAAMFIGNGDGKFEERRPYYIQDKEIGQGRHCRIRHFKFTAGAPVYFVLADRDGRYTVCKCEVADPLATRKIENGTYKTMTVEMTEVHSGVVNGETTEELARILGLQGLLAGPIVQTVRRVSKPRQSSLQPESSVATTGPETSESAESVVA
jgi:hypothetical protein